MRWITDKEEFRSVLIRANECSHVDSGRSPSAGMTRLVFDDVQHLTFEFADLIQSLLNASRDPAAFWIVLNPDPVDYFHRHFKRYPVLEISAGDTRESYISHLNEDPGGSPVDAIGINCYTWLVAPLSGKWFAHMMRRADSNGGHLWVAAGSATQLRRAFSFLRDENE